MCIILYNDMVTPHSFERIKEGDTLCTVALLSNLGHYFEDFAQHVLLRHVLRDGDVEGVLLVLAGGFELFKHLEEEAHVVQILSVPRRQPLLLALLCHCQCDEDNVGA